MMVRKNGRIEVGELMAFSALWHLSLSLLGAQKIDPFRKNLDDRQEANFSFTETQQIFKVVSETLHRLTASDTLRNRYGITPARLALIANVVGDVQVAVESHKGLLITAEALLDDLDITPPDDSHIKALFHEYDLPDIPIDGTIVAYGDNGWRDILVVVQLDRKHYSPPFQERLYHNILAFHTAGMTTQGIESWSGEFADPIPVGSAGEWGYSTAGRTAERLLGAAMMTFGVERDYDNSIITRDLKRQYDEASTGQEKFAAKLAQYEWHFHRGGDAVETFVHELDRQGSRSGIMTFGVQHHEEVIDALRSLGVDYIVIDVN